MQYESSRPMHSKDMAWKPFSYVGTDVRTYGRMVRTGVMLYAPIKNGGGGIKQYKKVV